MPKIDTTKKLQPNAISVESTITRKDLNIKLSRHCIATVIAKDPSKLLESKAFLDTVHRVLDSEGVQCVGEVTYDFQNRSFTSVIALAESHISVHTWPERHTVQLDVFLCNYVNDNTDKCSRIFEAIIEYFDPLEIERTFVERL